VKGAKYTLGILKTPFAAQTASKVGRCPTSACSLRYRVRDIENSGYSARKKTANPIEQVSPYSTVKQPAAQSRVKCQGPRCYHRGLYTPGVLSRRGPSSLWVNKGLQQFIYRTLIVIFVLK
jgi:hypothetical protein